jgi:ribosome maturation factor RimP
VGWGPRLSFATAAEHGGTDTERPEEVTQMTLSDEVARVVTAALEPLDVALYDLEMTGSVLRVSIDRPGGIDIDSVALANKAVSRALDEADPIPGAYTLEVSSPGLERTLRTTAHLEAAIGEKVKLKLNPGAAAGRRLEGVLRGATDDSITVETDEGEPHQVDRVDIERVRTVFEWGPAPKPTRAKSGGRPTKEAHT